MPLIKISNIRIKASIRISKLSSSCKNRYIINLSFDIDFLIHKKNETRCFYDMILIGKQ